MLPVSGGDIYMRVALGIAPEPSGLLASCNVLKFTAALLELLLYIYLSRPVQRFAPMLRVAVPYGQLTSRQTRMMAKIARDFDKGDAMSNPTKARKPDSTVDAWAILFLIILVVATAVFWVSHQ